MVVRRASSSAPLPTPSSEEDEDERPIDFCRLAALTALYAFVEGAVTHPYELVKTRQQVRAPSCTAHQLGTLEYMLQLHRRGGPRELYRGLESRRPTRNCGLFYNVRISRREQACAIIIAGGRLTTGRPSPNPG